MRIIHQDISVSLDPSYVGQFISIRPIWNGGSMIYSPLSVGEDLVVCPFPGGQGEHSNYPLISCQHQEMYSLCYHRHFSLYA